MPRFRRLAAASAAGVATLGLAACGLGGSSSVGSGRPRTVVVHSYKYRPATITVRAGQDVTWEFRDGGVPHDVKGPGFRSPRFTNKDWTHTFAATGRFEYICTIHPFMKGTVKVTKAP
jgi:plastocyanin